VRFRLPGPFVIYAASVAGIFGLLTAARGPVDADYYWHFVAGRLIAERGVLTTDPFSYTWGGQPWVMHEWLGELVIFRLVEALGVGITGFLFGVVSIAGLLVVAWALRRRGVGILPLTIATSLVAYPFVSYATIRPQAISWLLLGVLVAGLLRIGPERRWVPWLAVPLFALWANLHGLYVIGLGVSGIYVLFTLAGRTALSPRRWEIAGILGASFAASMLTPAGPAGLLYPLRYIEGGDWGLQYISEWQSPDFHDPAQVGLLILILAVLAVGMRAAPAWMATLALCGVLGALLATRNVPIAAILVLPTLAVGLGDRLPTRVVARPARVQLGRRIMELGLAAVIVGAAAAILPSLPAVAGNHVIPRTFPVEAVERLGELDPDARVFTEYGWGGFVIHRLHDTGARVFVDGRNDMYDDAILEDFVTIRNAEDGWEDALEAYGAADAILLPPQARLVTAAAEAGWCELHRDGVAVLLLRECPSARESGDQGPPVTS